MKEIDNKELIEALDELEKERKIDKNYLLESIETALTTAYKRNFDNEENVNITMDSTTGDIHVYANKEIVETVENPQLQINVEQAQKMNKNLGIGDTIGIEIFPKDFGRIAAQTAKQVIIQKIREAERTIIFSEFNDRKGEIVSGIVVEKGIKGNVQVIVSRAHSDFVRKLFEFEIPEIYEGLIEIKSVSRDPGYRSKVAVYSPNENIDPVGSCVGQKGIRIQNIINELNGEKIDVIEWNEDPAIYIASALLPAQVMAVDIKAEEKFAQVVVPDNQLSLAIGKSGQNARLAAKLTNWKIDIKSESQFRELLNQANSEKTVEE